MGRRPDLICLSETSIFVTLATKVASNRWVTEQHLVPLLSICKTNSKNTSNLRKNGSSTAILCVQTHQCQLEDAVSKKQHPRRREHVKNWIVFLFFLFHRCPVDNPSKDSILSDKRRSDAFSSCLFTRSTVNNQHLREFPDALCQSLGKKKKKSRLNYGSNPKPQWLPHPTLASVKWQSCRIHQLIS